jgi:hypothetical protein
MNVVTLAVLVSIAQRAVKLLMALARGTTGFEVSRGTRGP